jgi:MFS family permease
VTQPPTDRSGALSGLPRATSFGLLAALLTLLLFAASAPSPLYAVYQAVFQFSAITLTAIYAVYALGALVALLVTGRLSDRVGRRPVTALGLLIQIAAMVAFIAAQGVTTLYVARVLQGLGTGIATGSISAWLIDLQPPDEPRLGGLAAGIALIGGLGLGPLGSGVLVEFAPDPMHLVFWLLAALFTLAFAGLPFVPDVVERTPHWLESVRPRVAVPVAARPAFFALAPSLVAVWAIGGFDLSLGPSLASSLLRSNSHLAGGLVITALFGAGALAAFQTRSSEPRLAVIRGSLLLIGGVAITLLGVLVGSAVGIYAGCVVTGLGFGPAFSGTLRSIAPLAPPGERGALLAATYVVLYLAFSIPAVLAGAAVTLYGLPGTTFAFGLVVIALAGLTTIVVSGRVAGARASR